MVDVNTQNKTISVNVSSSGVSSNVNASGDTTMYYSNKAREWAISNRIVDGVDYSSKYYAGRANQSALNAQSFAQSAQDSYNNFQDSVDGALSTVNDTVQDAITTIDTKSGEAIEIINNTVDGVIEDIEAEANEQIDNIERTGFYMRDDKLYFINSKGEEEEFKSGGSGFSLFDRKVSDHILEGEEALGWALQGTWVYKEAIAGERFGYPTFYETCVKEYFDGNTAELIPWEQPVLSSDGELGGESFAVMADSVYPSNYFYRSFDGNDSTMWFAETAAPVPINLYLYNPKALIITNIEMTNRDKQRTYISGGVVYGSNDNATWVELKTFTNSVSDPTAKWNIDLSDNSRKFKYYRITITDIVYASATSILGVGNITITAFTSESTNLYYSHPNGHTYYDISIKDQIDEQFNSTGMAWCYGVDTDNERIFLPRNKWFEQMTLDTNEVGDSVLAGLPNITGRFYVNSTSSESGANGGGAFTVKSINDGQSPNGDDSASYRFNFDASRSNAIYGGSTTVQPNAVKKLLYICVGNTVSDTSWVNVVEQVQEGVKDIQEAEEEAIARLNATSNALNQTQITNCILEVPQNIKLELTNGVLTLKAGSKITWGGEEYKTTVVADDKTYTYTGSTTNANCVVCVARESGTIQTLTNITTWSSGSSAPTETTTGKRYFDYTNKIFYLKKDDGWKEWTIGYPIATVTLTNGIITSIDQVFNGFGYIGSYVWKDKGVKALSPNGFNDNGTFSNIEWQTELLNGRQLSGSGTFVLLTDKFGSFDYVPTSAYDITSNPSSTCRRYYNPIDNFNYNNESGNKQTGYVYIGTCTLTDGKITSFDVKQPVRLVDYNDIKDNVYITETYRNGTSWYRIYSDGWCEQGGLMTATNDGYNTVSLLQEYINTDFTVLTTSNKAYASGSNTSHAAAAAYGAIVQNPTTTSFEVYCQSSSQKAYWETKGYIR